jgi:hypothetical protein
MFLTILHWVTCVGFLLWSLSAIGNARLSLRTADFTHADPKMRAMYDHAILKMYYHLCVAVAAAILALATRP